MSNLKEFYFTFGVQYPRQKHKRYEKANGDGYVVVEAKSHESARAFFVDHVAGLEFATSYSRDHFDPDGENIKKWFPLGEIERFKISN